MYVGDRGDVDLYFNRVLLPLVAVAVVCVLTALLRPSLSSGLRWAGVVSSALVPVLTMGALALEFSSPSSTSPAGPLGSSDPLVSLGPGFWALTGGCALIAAAALAVPRWRGGRVSRSQARGLRRAGP